MQAPKKSGKGRKHMGTAKSLPRTSAVQLLSFLQNEKVRLIEMLLFLW